MGFWLPRYLGGGGGRLLNSYNKTFDKWNCRNLATKLGNVRMPQSNARSAFTNIERKKTNPSDLSLTCCSNITA